MIINVIMFWNIMFSISEERHTKKVCETRTQTQNRKKIERIISLSLIQTWTCYPNLRNTNLKISRESHILVIKKLRVGVENWGDDVETTIKLWSANVIIRSRDVMSGADVLCVFNLYG